MCMALAWHQALAAPAVCASASRLGLYTPASGACIAYPPAVSASTSGTLRNLDGELKAATAGSSLNGSQHVISHQRVWVKCL
eukprot:UN2187